MPHAVSLRNGTTVRVVGRDGAFWLHLGFVCLSGTITAGFPLMLLRAQMPYPDLHTITLIVSVGTMLTLLFAWVIVGQTASLQLLPGSIVVRKRWQRSVRHPYETITAHNLRKTGDRYCTWLELTVYLTDDWFALRSVDFPDFDELAARFAVLGPAVPYRPVLSPSEQRLARGFLLITFLAGLGPVWFGFVAYESVSNQPVPLVNVSGRLAQVRVTRNRGQFTGVDFR